MSLKNSYTTSDYLQWDSATTLVRKLYRDKNYRISLLIGCGIFFGLRISDLLRLTWNMLLNSEAKFVLIEKKTGKRREVKITRNFRNISRTATKHCILRIWMSLVSYLSKVNLILCNG